MPDHDSLHHTSGQMAPNGEQVPVTSPNSNSTSTSASTSATSAQAQQQQQQASQTSQAYQDQQQAQQQAYYQQQYAYYQQQQSAQAAQAAASIVQSQQSKTKLQDNLAFHILMVALISLLLLIPTLFFSWVLSDRMSNEYNAIDSMVEAWGGDQKLTDPEITLVVATSRRITSYDKDSNEVVSSSSSIDYEDYAVAPTKASTSVNISTEKRYRGNYEASLYTVEVQQEASFDLSAAVDSLFSRPDVSGVPLDAVSLLFNVSDSKGINEIKSLYVNGVAFTPAPSAKNKGFMVELPRSFIEAIIDGRPWQDNSRSRSRSDEAAGIDYSRVPVLRNTFYVDAERDHADETAVAAVNAQLKEQQEADALEQEAAAATANAATGELKLKITYLVRGSQMLSFYPLGQVSELKVNGTGAVPSFGGDFLPRERSVDANAMTFSASYYQNNLSTGHAVIINKSVGYSGDFNNKGYVIDMSDTSKSYVLIDRLTKYVLLVIALTYVSVLAFEIVSGVMVSLVQYVVVGVALIMFYLVLLSLSEHADFTLSYVVAALLMSSMIALYLKAVLNSKRNAICIFLLLLAVYAVLFAIVHIEAYALLVGTILLVIMLGIVMFITRKLNSGVVGKVATNNNKEKKGKAAQGAKAA